MSGHPTDTPPPTLAPPVLVPVVVPSRNPTNLMVLIFNVAVCCALAFVVLWYFTSKNYKRISIFYKVTLLCAFFTCFLPVGLLVVDIDEAIYPSTTFPDKLLFVIWKGLFWLTQLYTWLWLPLAQSFDEVGQFTFRGKLWASIKENIILFGGIGVVLGILMIWIAFRVGALTPLAFVNLCMAASNSFGLFLLMLSLGYGLVEFPRHIFFKGDVGRCLRLYQYKAPSVSEECEFSQIEWADDVATVNKLDMCVSRDDALRPYVDILVGFVEKSEIAHPDLPPRRITEFETDVSMNMLISLHRKLRKDLRDMEKYGYLWKRLQYKAFHLEDVRKTALASPVGGNDRQQLVRSVFRRQRTGRFSEYHDRFEAFYWAHARSVLLKSTGVIMTLISLALFWSQMVLPWKVTMDYSIVHLLIKLLDDQKISRAPVTVVFLVYMAFIAYWSLFRVKFIRAYALVPGHSVPAALCFSTVLLCRLMMPICFNALLVARLKTDNANDSQIKYTQAMGNMETEGFLGAWFSRYFMPIVLLLMGIITMFNLSSRLLHAFGMKSFTLMDKDALENDENIEEGREILTRARINAERLVVVVVGDSRTDIHT